MGGTRRKLHPSAKILFAGNKERVGERVVCCVAKPGQAHSVNRGEDICHSRLRAFLDSKNILLALNETLPRPQESANEHCSVQNNPVSILIKWGTR
jgi:hypothetical protein